MCVCSFSFSFAGLLTDVEQTHGWHLSMSKHVSLCKISMKCSAYGNFCKPTQAMSFLWNCYSEPSSRNKYNITIKGMYILVTAKVDMHISDKCK